MEQNQVPVMEVVDRRGPDTGGMQGHTLGLHDLLKAAFSQEPSADFTDFDHKMEKSEIDCVLPEKVVDPLFKTNMDDTYQLYTMKTIPFVELRGDENKDLKTDQLVYSSDMQDVRVGTVNRTFESYESEDTNSVLDLDKGIQIQIGKVYSTTGGDTVHYQYQQKTYPGDTQILHRYLCDSSTFIKSESTDLSNPSSGHDDSFLFLRNNNDVFEEKNVGVSPETLGVRYEDCDFNSSDSFASTESIIPKNIKCPKCPKKFMFKSDLLRHDKYKHNLKMKLSCKYCSKEFASQQNLVFHEKSHKKKPGNKCETCDKSFKKVGFLIKHMLKKHAKTPYSCVSCSQVCTSQLLLNAHIKREHAQQGDKPFKCSVCDKFFSTKQGLSCHVTSHTEFPYTCELCNKSFSKICYLKNHQKAHGCEDTEYVPCEGSTTIDPGALGGQEQPQKKNSEKPFTCDTCFKSFANKAYFKVHMKKHLESKPHQCSMCQKSFITSADLVKHERTHTKEKPFSCINCNQSFAQQSNLIAHWKKQRCTSKTQEICTQTSELDLLNGKNDVYTLPSTVEAVHNVNLVLDQSSLQGQAQPILLTSIGGYIDSTAVPITILAPSPSSGISYSLSSIPS